MDSCQEGKRPSGKNLQRLRAAFHFQPSLAAVCRNKQRPELRGDQASDFSAQASSQPHTWEASTQPVASPRSPS